MSRDLQLILVDLDNLLFDQTGSFPLPCIEPRHDYNWLDTTGPEPDTNDTNDTNAPCVVVYAMNLDTAARPMVTFDALHDLAGRLASLVARGRLAGVEIALTLPIKQSADKALERLLKKTAVPDHEGPLVAVHLLSRDEGLRRSIHDELLPRCKADALEADFLSSWTTSGTKKRAKRAPEKRRPSLVSTITRPENVSNVAIDTPALAGWAETQPIDLETCCSLNELAAELLRRPGLLTQVGLTLSCMRGVGRLRRLAAGELPQIITCTANDGIELGVTKLRAGPHHGVSRSTLGAGAVRFVEPRATARTLLPPAAFDIAVGAIDVRADGSVDDTAHVRGCATGIVDGTRLSVEFARRGDALRAEIHGAFGEPLPAWWWLGDKTRNPYQFTLRNVQIALSRRMSNITAVSDLRTVGNKRVVSVSTPIRGVTRAKLDKDLPGGALGVAVLPDNTRLAVLADENVPLVAGARSFQPIQDLSLQDWQRRYPKLQEYSEELTHLPIVVTA